MVQVAQDRPEAQKQDRRSGRRAERADRAGLTIWRAEHQTEIVVSATLMANQAIAPDTGGSTISGRA